MVSKKYFGTDGIRGKVGEYPITPEFMLKLGYAVGKVLGAKDNSTVVVGKDTRVSGYMLESALESGLSAAGVDSLLLGPMPTPAIAYLTRAFRAQAGIVVSASHNPYYDNGIKFFSSEGQKLPDDIELAIEAELEKPLTVVSSDKLGKAARVDDAVGRYVEFCKGTIASDISLKGLKIVVDCANGATYHIAPKVFKELGAEVIELFVAPDGFNINKGCGATDVKELQKTVKVEGAALGIALDGDGDRLIMVDHLGNIVDGDQILYIIAKYRQSQHKLQGGVVGTVMSNLGMELGFKALNIPFERVNVGDRYVLEALNRLDWKYGGESSGHIICLDKTTTGAGIIAALQVLAVIVNTQQDLASLANDMQKFPQVMINVKVTNKLKKAFNDHPDITAAVNEVEQKLGTTGRVLLRPSGTEPLIRVMVEGEHHDTVSKLAKALAARVEALANNL